MRIVLLIPNRTLKLSDGIVVLGSVFLVRLTRTIQDFPLKGECIAGKM